MGQIRDAQLDILQTSGEEFIEFKKYSSDGTFIETLDENVLISAPDLIIPIKSDLTIEYLKPIKKVIQNTKTPKRNIVNNDPMFNYGGYQFNVETSSVVTNDTVASYVNLSSSPQSLSGERMLQCDEDATITTEEPTSSELAALETAWSTNEDYTLVRNGSDFEIGFSYYNDNGLADVDYFFAINVAYVIAGGFLQYNFDENRFDQNITYSTDKKYFFLTKNKTTNKWQNFSKVFTGKSFGSNINLKLQVKCSEVVYLDAGEQASHEVTFFDNLFVANFFDQSDNIIIENERNDSLNFTGELETKDTLISNELGTIPYNNAITDLFFTRKNGSGNRDSLEAIISLEKLNDHRQYIRCFEGTFFNTDAEPIPISLHNKLWMNFQTDQQPVSAMIDHMEYSLKGNEYKLFCHLPNQDDDIDNDFYTNYE